MNIHEDFEEFLKLLNELNVEYVIVGGYAVAFHGYVRVTKDLDILFRNSTENIFRIRQALNKFGFPTDSLEDVAFSEEGKVIRMMDYIFQARCTICGLKKLQITSFYR